MLPSLKKTAQQFQASQIKLYNPPRELQSIEHQNERKSSLMSSSRANTKIKAVAGFKKGETNYDASKRQQFYTKSLQQPNYSSLHQNKQNIFGKFNSNKDLSAQIKLIEKKIRYHKKKLEQEKKRKQEIQKQKNDPYSKDFEKIIQKQMQMQGYIYGQEPKGFDYLTNPGKLNNEQQQLQQVEPQQYPQPVVIKQIKKFDITQKVQKLQKHYQNSLKKKFERRQMFPHYPCKRKTPKLYITQKTNALQKFGKKPAQQQHLFRVMTKQCTPQQIYPTIPNFAIVKDNLSKNVMAYLGDYKPFIDKTKQNENDKEQNENNFLGQDNGPENYKQVSNINQRPESQGLKNKNA